MVNPIRGEVESNLFGRPMTFCLTLGALAEIEVAFGEDGLRPDRPQGRGQACRDRGVEM
jgi:hypothetical protein